MIDSKIIAIHNDPKYQKFIKSRSRFSWAMTIIMLVMYFGYICLVAFDKDFLARPIGDGVTTLSIPVGIGLIVVTVLLTGFYVRRANSEFDRINQEILKEHS